MRKCIVCKNEFEAFVPIERKYLNITQKYGNGKKVFSELLNREEYSCPYCYAADRDRMIVMFMEKLHQKYKGSLDILEIAPSGVLQRYLFHEWAKCNLYSADLFMENVDYKIDIQNMDTISDEQFDFIVCSHVLEHVESDRKAIRELYRILNNKGLAIIIVPLDLNQNITDEEWGLSEEENIRRFGQADHCRKYNKDDYISRLKESGFYIHQIQKDFFEEELFCQNALLDTSTLYLVYKNKKLYNSLACLLEQFAYSHEFDDVKCCYQEVQDQVNYWFDVCEVKNNNLQVWGWAYIIGRDSKDVKFKLFLEGDTEDYIWGTEIRTRQDIQEKFGQQFDYKYSGVDVNVSIANVRKGTYKVWMLIHTTGEKYKVLIKENMKV